MLFDDDQKAMIVNDDDLDFILKTYVRTYRYFKDNKVPDEIIVRCAEPTLVLKEELWKEVQGAMIPIRFEVPNDSDRPERTGGDSKSGSTKRRRKSGTPESAGS